MVPKDGIGLRQASTLSKLLKTRYSENSGSVRNPGEGTWKVHDREVTAALNADESATGCGAPAGLEAAGEGDFERLVEACSLAWREG